MRDKLIHAYETVDLDEVSDAIGIIADQVAGVRRKNHITTIILVQQLQTSQT
ncbi:MAG: hypothetical protein HND44_07195 [Chloroflexi bacterium]|nr:hypothetical protein [Ardenticatenaceae bacterium]MBL1128275.1 hypothetical protein [Chloroflexota bacterium]NOG34347.1 hypothetical protein [Chloroflexota bacterium]GIK57349.1 MAG: hypothetical protein BroJett015_30120 [Chloroflexota bacterium]